MGEQLPDDNDKSEQSPDVTVKATQTIGKQSGGEANAVKFDRARDVQIHYHGKEAAEKPPLPYEPETVLIPAGPFLMGDDDNPITAPKHTVELPAFRIGCYRGDLVRSARLLRMAERKRRNGSPVYAPE